MTKLFDDSHRAFQDRFGTRSIADRIEQIALETTISDANRAFIEGRDMMFVATTDRHGQPTVSYKGGQPGFVRVLGPTTLAFPSYDGNGMFLSAGNAAASGLIGLLFIDFQTPNRLRVQGRASVMEDDPLTPTFREAEFVIRVEVAEVWPNCPRYVHRYDKVATSRYVPTEDAPTPMAAWKRIDIVQDALPAKDRARAAEAGGTVTIEEWMGQVGRGEG